jgi:prophage regulatory protein
MNRHSADHAADESARLIALPEILEKMRTSRSTLYLLVAKGRFPRPLKIGRSSRWVAADVAEFIANAVNAQRGATKSCPSSIGAA